MVTEIKIRQDTTENWVAINPILADGELGYDTTVLRFKVGNGVAKWTELSYTKSDMYNDSLINEKINQINEDLSQKSNSTDVYTKQQIEDMLFVTADELFTKNYMEKNEALDKFITRQEVWEQNYGYVPTERTINGKELSEDIVLDYTDVQALPDTTYIPQKMSDLENDEGYTTQLDVMQAIASIPQFKLQIVDSLPKDNPEPMVLYLVSKGGSAPDVYDEYIWLEETGNYEFLGTTAVDLTGYVKNTDYATASNAGVIKAYAQNGFGVNNAGQPFSQTVNLSSYKGYGGNFFIGKGTLENIKYDLVKDGVVNNSIGLGDSDKEKVRNWIGASSEVIQRSSFEFLPADRNANRICQYIGETNKEFTNGYFYKSVLVGENYSINNSDIVTFDFDAFWSELNIAGITKESLRLTDEMYTTGGFRIIGTPISETQIRITNINGFSVDVVLNNTVTISQKLLSVGGETSFSYYREHAYSWMQHNTQPSAKTLLITEDDYNALETKDENTLYLIEE